MVSASSVWHIFPLCFCHPGSAPLASHAWFLKFFLMLILCLPVLSATLIQDHYSTHLHLPHYTPLICDSAQSLLWKHLKHVTSPVPALLLARHLQITEMVGLPTTVSWTLAWPPSPEPWFPLFCN